MEKGGQKIRKFCRHHIWKLPNRLLNQYEATANDVLPFAVGPEALHLRRGGVRDAAAAALFSDVDTNLATDDCGASVMSGKGVCAPEGGTHLKMFNKQIRVVIVKIVPAIL